MCKQNAENILPFSEPPNALTYPPGPRQAILTSHSTQDGGIPVDERHQFNHDCLQHLHVFRPQTHQSLVATIDNLQQYFLSNTTSHYSANRPLGAIFINDLSAFFWQIRQEAEEIKDAALERPGQEPLDKGIDILSKRYSNLVEALSKAQRVFDCLIIATNSALAAPSRTRDGSSLRSHLPGAWNRFRTFNIVLQVGDSERCPPPKKAFREQKHQDMPSCWQTLACLTT